MKCFLPPSSLLSEPQGALRACHLWLHIVPVPWPSSLSVGSWGVLYKGSCGMRVCVYTRVLCTGSMCVTFSCQSGTA